MFDCRLAAALFQPVGSSLAGRFGDFDAIDDSARAGGFRHPGHDPFVLDHIRTAVQRGDAALDAEFELPGGQLRPGQPRAEVLFDLCVRKVSGWRDGSSA